MSPDPPPAKEGSGSRPRAQRQDPELAEAYDLLGMAEARSVEIDWVPQSDFHLEVALRQDPGGRFAKDA